MRKRIALVGVLGLALAVSCAHRLERKVGPTLQTVDMTAPVLQAHMRDGSVFILEHWTIDERAQVVRGTGQRLGPDRMPTPAGVYDVPIAQVALFETNTIVASPSVAAMAVVTGISAAVTAACIANPKACFGSCPTFYAPDDATGRPVLQAEGFSDAIAPALEKHDLDALYRTTGHGGPFTLTLTNEAYETHVIKQADLLVVPRPPGGRVLATTDELWLASSVTPPTACDAPEGDCTDAVRAVDGVERTSVTDGSDLAARETIDLAFAPAPAPAGGRLGIAVAARQSLVTTFLMYQGLAYLGRQATDWLSKLERGDALASAGGRALRSLVGGIEVQLLGDDGAWHTVDEVYETGPLATDVHLVVLPEGARADRVRLRLPRGGWRIDHVALAQLTGRAQPVRVSPHAIAGTLGAEYAGDRRAATSFPIVTLPGDRYELSYTLPPGGDNYELVLDSRGYYLEWMRDSWMREENPLAAVAMFLDPARAMRDLAPAYKKLEPTAEQLFWSSRYAHP